MSASADSRPPPRNPIVLIPARMASQRLPGKPLADIAGRPMIVHVLQRAEAAAIGPVVVACAEPAIAEAVESAGGRAVMTDPDHPSRLRPNFRGAAGDRPGGRLRRGGQPAGRPAHPRPHIAGPRPGAPGGPCRRCRHARSRDRQSGGAGGPQRGQGRGLVPAGRHPGPRALLHPRDRACGRRGRSGTTSASTRTGARHWPASSRSRPARWSAASGWSSSARSRTGCASRSPSSTRSRSASIRRRSSRRRGR